MPTKIVTGTGIVTGLGAIALIAPSLAQAQDGTGEAAEHWAAIAQCAAIDRAEARHRCMDDVVRRAGLLSDARLAQSARQEFGNAGRPAPSPAPAPDAPRNAQDINELVTTVASARLAGDRRLVVVTAEGSVWEQAQSETIRTVPQAGGRFAIVRSALGGFRCSFERSTVYRCRRVD